MHGDVDGVYPDGHADLTLSEDFVAVYYFLADSASKRPANLPRGVDAEIPCMVLVSLTTIGLEAFVANDAERKQPLRPATLGCGA